VINKVEAVTPVVVEKVEKAIQIGQSKKDPIVGPMITATPQLIADAKAAANTVKTVASTMVAQQKAAASIVSASVTSGTTASYLRQHFYEGTRLQDDVEEPALIPHNLAQAAGDFETFVGVLSFGEGGGEPPTFGFGAVPAYVGVGGVPLALPLPHSGILLAEDAPPRRGSSGTTDDPPPARGSSSITNTSASPSKPPVEPADRGTYGDLKSRKRSAGETEPLDMDHQPSFAAQRAAEEKALGRELTAEEERALRNDSPAVASPRKVHQQTSPTYGGRNSPSRIAGDAANRKAAEARDRAAFEKAMKLR
jgi:filamentous hemagglutinin